MNGDDRHIFILNLHTAKGRVLGHTNGRSSYAALPVNAVECPQKRAQAVMFTFCSGDKRGIAELLPEKYIEVKNLFEQILLR